MPRHVNKCYKNQHKINLLPFIDLASHTASPRCVQAHLLINITWASEWEGERCVTQLLAHTLSMRFFSTDDDDDALNIPSMSFVSAQLAVITWEIFDVFFISEESASVNARVIFFPVATLKRLMFVHYHHRICCSTLFVIFRYLSLSL